MRDSVLTLPCTLAATDRATAERMPSGAVHLLVEQAGRMTTVVLSAGSAEVLHEWLARTRPVGGAAND